MSELLVFPRNITLVHFDPVKRHKKRANQSDFYHKRIQKKWIKRFGEKEISFRVRGLDQFGGVVNEG